MTRHNALERDEDGREIAGDVAVPEFVIEIFDRAGGVAVAAHIEEARPAADAGIDEDNVKAPETVDHVRDGFAHRGPVGHVRLLSHDVRRYRRKPGFRLIELGGIAIENADAGAVVGEHLRARIADTARPAGDQRDLTVNTEKLGYFHMRTITFQSYMCDQ
jgi:hypothetical protein